MIEGIIFDLDGTILDTIEDLTDSLNYALDQVSVKGYEAETVVTFVGNGMRTLVQRALVNRQSVQDVDNVLEMFKQHYSSNYNNKTKAYPNMKEVVDNAKKSGFYLGVCSNKPNEFVQHLIAEHFDKDTFAFVLGEVPFIERKPAPDMALEVAANLGLAPHECLFVGDSTVDIKTAKAAKMPICAVTYGFNSEEMILKEKPEYTVNDVAGLDQVIRALAS
jgi:phosphoglycolate phosphatase